MYEQKDIELYKLRLPYILRTVVDRDALKMDQFIIVVPQTDDGGDQWSGWIAQVKKFLGTTTTKLSEKMEKV